MWRCALSPVSASTTTITSPIAITRVRSTSWRDDLIVVDRSELMAMSTAGGIDARSCGRRPMTRSTVSMMFAFGLMIANFTALAMEPVTCAP